MYPKLAEDLSGTDALLSAARAGAERGLHGLATRPVWAGHPAHGPAPLPEDGIGGAAALAEFERVWEPGLSGSAGPRYFGFVTGGATPASVIGDWLTSTYDQNVVVDGDSAAPDLERQTVSWLSELFGLGDDHAGAFVSGATMSNFVGLALAREWLGEQLGVSIAESGSAALGEVTVLSGSPHASIYKAASMLGIGRNAVRRVDTLPGREAVDVHRLDAELSRLAGRPAIVVANAGTVNSVDFDDLAAIAALRGRHPFWLHVDGAFGAFAALVPEFAHLVRGIDEADSVCADLHKWLNVPYDSAVQFTRRRDLQVRVFNNAADYVSRPDERPDFVHLTPESSRRWRALAAWFSLTAYGRNGHREIVARNIALARDLGARLAEVPHLRLQAPVRLNVVCWTLADNPSRARIDAVVAAINGSGETVVTPTVYDGTPGVRVAFSNWRTTAADTDRAFAAIAEHTAGR